MTTSGLLSGGPMPQLAAKYGSDLSLSLSTVYKILSLSTVSKTWANLREGMPQI